MSRKEREREGLGFFYIPRGEPIDLERDITRWEADEIFEHMEHAEDDPSDLTLGRTFARRQSMDKPLGETLRHMLLKSLDNPVRLAAVLGSALLIACLIMVAALVL